MTATNEHIWILKAWSQDALVSARAEARRLEAKPNKRAALNELSAMLHVAWRYAEMAGEHTAGRWAEQALDEVFSLRMSGNAPTMPWLNALLNRIEAAESALMANNAVDGPCSPKAFRRRALRDRLAERTESGRFV